MKFGVIGVKLFALFLAALQFVATTWSPTRAACFDYGEASGAPPGIRLDGFSQTYDVAVAGDRAYVADLSGGLWVVDVAIPLEPQVIGLLPLPDQAVGVAVKDSYAYVVDLQFGLRVVDIADPENLQLVASLATPGNAFDIVIKGNHALITDNLGFQGSLLTVDIVNPLTPRIVKTLAMPDNATGLALSGPYAYVACWESGLQIVEMYDPRYPRLAGLAPTPEPAWRVAVSGDGAYVSARETGLMVVDVYSPWFPESMGYLAGLEDAWDVTVTGTHVYIGSQVVDVAEPAHPRWVGGLGTPGRARGLAVLEDRLLVTEEGPGLSILPLQCEGISAVPNPTPMATTPLLGQNHPNPFNPTTTIAFELPQEARVTLEIFDPTGRRVRVLLEEEAYPRGRHEVAWNGREDGGRPAAAGLYLYRLTAGGHAVSRRMTLLK